ncbi:Uncharacterised protein [Moraxella cuniculi]|uniref:Uncharacterized protein n=1 Tax=Moraxella cuniculi TaxID=34061 RepID=A0A3S4T0F4_9GAMM|nr:Uncharacterised protein [Moraxella cuniculi]
MVVVEFVKWAAYDTVSVNATNFRFGIKKPKRCQKPVG